MSKAVLYKIRIYGSVSQDTEPFVSEMAPLLGMNEEELRSLLQHLPATAEKLITGEIAEIVRRRSIELGGLVLLEPCETEEQEPEKNLSPVGLAKEFWNQRPSIGDSLQTKLWFGAVITLSGFIALFTLVAFLSSLWQTYRWNNPPPGKPGLSASASSKAASKDPAKVFRQTNERISALRTSIEDLQLRLGTAERSFRQLKTAHSIDRKYRLVRSAEIGELRRKITEKFADMRKLELLAKIAEEQSQGRHQ